MIIISRCPYRISLLGGSSDLDWYVNEYGRGLSIGFSIKFYTRVISSFREFSERGILNYSSREEYKDNDSISHPIIRSCIKKFDIKKKLELTSIGESLSGSGLGSSSSFTVALIKVLSELNDIHLNNNEIAHLASEIEINDLEKPIGRQDQYLCALGGVNVLEFRSGGVVNVLNQSNLTKAIENFSKKLYLIDTTIVRNASEKLSDLKKEKNTSFLINNILETATSFIEKSKSLDVNQIEDLLKFYIKKAWQIKRQMYGVMTNELINIEEIIVDLNFSVLKLLGAGGGGYFLVSFNGKDIESAKARLKDLNLNLKKIELSNEGCSSCVF